MSEDERGTRRADSPRNALVNISPLTDPNIEATQREPRERSAAIL